MKSFVPGRGSAAEAGEVVAEGGIPAVHRQSSCWESLYGESDGCGCSEDKSSFCYCYCWAEGVVVEGEGD